MKNVWTGFNKQQQAKKEISVYLSVCDCDKIESWV